MKYNRIIAIYFSATDTTKKYVEAAVSVFGSSADCLLNLANDMDKPLPELTANDIVVIAAPVYGGRLPQQVAARFKRLRGNGAKAIAIVVYGNRDYDDALLELVDINNESGLTPVGAAAFIGQHSIFPRVARNRPDYDDIKSVVQFATECKNAIENSRHSHLVVKGNRPYKKIMGVGLSPKVDKNVCNSCGICASNCPAGAIKKEDPTATIADKCIACGRCIHNCPHDARKFSGLKYSIINAIFTKAFSKKKESEFSVVK